MPIAVKRSMFSLSHMMGKFESNDFAIAYYGGEKTTTSKIQWLSFMCINFPFLCKQEVELFYSIQEVKAPFEKEDTFSSLAPCKQCFYVCINKKYSVQKK